LTENLNHYWGSDMKSETDINERLSALLDDESGQVESLELFRRLENDRELATKWNRYALAKEMMQSRKAMVVDLGFVYRVHAALEPEPAILAPRVVRHRFREKAVTMALAASIAMLAVLVGRSVNFYSPLKSSEMLAQNESSVSSLPAVAAVDPHLKDYLAMHNETTYLAGSQGMLPSIRLVSGSR